jgi:ribosomal protein S18 acetylase RimI-like enzyme
MTQPVAFRLIQDEDLEFLYQVYASTREEELAPVPWTDDEKEAFLRGQFHAQHVHYQQHYAQARFEVVLAGGQPVGRLYVDRREDEIRIVDIALLPEHRGAGIGGAILKDLLAEGAEAGKPVRIHVERNNPAMRFYRRLGFTQIGDAGVYFLMEWSPDSVSEGLN